MGLLVASLAKTKATVIQCFTLDTLVLNNRLQGDIFGAICGYSGQDKATVIHLGHRNIFLHQLTWSCNPEENISLAIL